MGRTVIARGRLSDPRHIELAEPVSEIHGDVEVEIRPLHENKGQSVFEVIAALQPGTRSIVDIDEQIHEERASWGDR